ncbi:MAG: hypothetical protein R3A13_00180 [Bdellovibrionota bacterium]
MNLSKVFKFLITTVLTVALLYSYNHSRWPNKGRVQIQFEKWLSQIDLRDESNKLEIKLSYGTTNSPALFSLNSSLSQSQVLRILELAKTANIFSLKNEKTDYQLNIIGSKNFYCSD